MTIRKRFRSRLLSAFLLVVLGLANFDVADAQPGLIWPRQAPSSGLQPAVSLPVQQDQIATLPADLPGSGQSLMAVPSPRPRNTKPVAAEDTLFSQSTEVDGALQVQAVTANMPAPKLVFEGISNINNVLPPDPTGDVGPNHYVQWVNLSMAVWQLDRTQGTATLVYGPASGNALWAGFGGACQNSNDGDPIVQYDHMADRWMVSQFALPNYPSGPFYECIAVSQTGDPTGGWYRYAYAWTDGAGTPLMNDYPKFGVWPDGYYMSTNQFAAGSEQWRGAGVAAFERDKMLQGLPARMVYFNLYPINTRFGSLLPSDLDGQSPPPGTPNYFAEVDDSTVIAPTDAMRIWEFHVDWSNPANSTFGLSGQPNLTLPVAAFAPLCYNTQQCIPQPTTRQRLDAIGERLMYRLQFRYFDEFSTLVANQTVDAGGGRAGIRWYELRQSGSGWSIYQQGTYAGNEGDTANRWMGSAAMDSAGNIGIGYSVSSASVYPSIRYAGRRAGDPLGTLPQGESTLVTGTGSQTSPYARWGDYSTLSIDPLDECTFWYTQEYIALTGDRSWRTKIGAFSFDGCQEGQKGNLKGQVIDSATQQGIPKASVSAGDFTTLTDANGNFTFIGLPIGQYTVSVSAYAYEPAVSTRTAEIRYNQTTQMADFVLTPVPRVTIQGSVQDGSGQGWPLYARIDVSAQGLAEPVFTDPETGAYTIQLGSNISHTFSVQAISRGYVPQAVIITPTIDTTRNFTLTASSTPPCPPGYGGQSACEPLAGGLLVGNVWDANTGLGVNGATVASLDQVTETTTTVATPEDPHVADGFYTLFSSNQDEGLYRASQSGYQPNTQPITVVPDQIVRADFTLTAPLLTVDPTVITTTLLPKQTASQALRVTNTGGVTATFTISEVNGIVPFSGTTGPFAPFTRHVSFKRFDDLTAEAVNFYDPPESSRISGGQVLQSWPSGLAHPWGVGYDTRRDALWIGNVAVGGGDDRLYRFAPTGQDSGDRISRQNTGSAYAADMTFHPFTGMLWQINVAGDNCVVEIDPETQNVTGKSICPGFDNPQRGLAYNPLDRSFYSGSWIDGILNHFSSDGRMLDSAAIGINISGLAYNPATNHLFVLSNANTGFDVFVLEAVQPYRILGGFDIGGFELPGLDNYTQAGLELDCLGHLWTVNQSTGAVLEVDSGENAPCQWNDIPWVEVTPSQGELSPGSSQVLTLAFDASAATSKVNAAEVLLENNTPYEPVVVPVTLNILGYGVGFNPGITALKGQPGETVSYTLQVTNTGDVADTYSISVMSGNWPASAPTAIGPIEPGETVDFSVQVKIPASVRGFLTDTTTVVVSSQSEPLVQVTRELTTYSRFLTLLPYIRFLRQF